MSVTHLPAKNEADDEPANARPRVLEEGAQLVPDAVLHFDHIAVRDGLGSPWTTSSQHKVSLWYFLRELTGLKKPQQERLPDGAGRHTEKKHPIPTAARETLDVERRIDSYTPPTEQTENPYPTAGVEGHMN